MLDVNESIENLGRTIKLVVSPEHTFGTDAILLAHFSAPKLREKACDLGTGCGIIPLFWCSKIPPKHISAVEIQPKACQQLEKSISLSGLNDKVQVINADLRNLNGLLPDFSFDLVTMNPPYKPVNTGFQNQSEAAKIARHEVMCDINSVTKAASSLLKFGGRFCLCHRPERLSDVFKAMQQWGIEPKRLRQVVHHEGNAPWLVLVEGKKGGKSGLIIEPQLVLKDRYDKYTDELKEILSEYGEGHF